MERVRSRIFNFFRSARELARKVPESKKLTKSPEEAEKFDQEHQQWELRMIETRKEEKVDKTNENLLFKCAL